MKLVKSLSVVAAFAAASLASQAAVGTAYDLVIGFYGAGASNDVEINLSTIGGKLNGSLLTAGTHDLGNYATLLNGNFGTDWTAVNWSAAAVSKTSANGVLFATSMWNDNTGTLGVADSASIGTPSSSTINSGITKVTSVYGGTLTNNLIGNGVANSFTKNSPFNLTGSNSSVVNVVNTVGNLGGSNFSASDLYSVNAASANGALGSTFLGTLAVYQNGEITFTVAAIPEPSTYAVILGALTIGFVALRRRFSKAV